MKDFNCDGWNAFFFPRARPTPIVHRLSAGDQRDHATGRRCASGLESLGLNVPGRDRRTPEYLQRLALSDLENGRAPVKASGAAEE